MPKVDRRITKDQEAIKKALIELMSEKSFDDITIQDHCRQKQNVNRGTIYLHYLDKFDLLDKIMEEHINNMSNFCESATEMDYIESTVHCMEYFKSNYLFFSTMLASEGAPYFSAVSSLSSISKSSRKDVDITKGKNSDQNEDVIVQFVANAYIGDEWNGGLKNGMPYPPRVIAEKVGDLLERIV